YYLVEGGPKMLDAHRKAFGAAVRAAAARGEPIPTLDEFGSFMSYKRLLDAHMSPATQYFYRYGFEAWQRKYKSHIDRDPATVLPGELWVSDHHQLDVGCTWETSLSMIPGYSGDVRVLMRDRRG